ncbi:MAG: SURF1 family protein, partial [Pseudomonadota bacterium]|nr:SURF1 family protein [Pseudomonadota bacterium]
LGGVGGGGRGLVPRLLWSGGLRGGRARRRAAAPVPLPEAPTEAGDEYLRVRVAGAYDGSELHVLTSEKPWGPGYRVIAGFDAADGRRIMVDRGFVEETRRDATRPGGPAEVTGALLWPDEVDGFTPDPDLAKNLWFARDVPPMAKALGAEPVLVVAEANAGDWPKALPLTVNLRNDHLNYAITWFGLAVVWAGMTGALGWRLMRRGEV